MDGLLMIAAGAIGGAAAGTVVVGGRIGVALGAAAGAWFGYWMSTPADEFVPLIWADTMPDGPL